MPCCPRGDQRGETWTQDSASERQYRDGDEQKRNTINTPQQRETDGHRAESHFHKTTFTERLDQCAHAAALNQNANQAGKREHIPDLFCSKWMPIVCEAAFGEKREAKKEGAESKRKREK